MHGCIHTWPLTLVLFLGLTGCSDAPARDKPQPNAAAASILGNGFDEAATGTIQGQVMWKGELPHAPPFKIFGLPGNYPIDIRKDQANPNLPHIESGSLAMADVIVFLRKVDLQRSKPWDHPNVRVEQRDRHLIVRQGDTQTNVGWVRKGESIEIVNEDVHFHMLRGRGAEFFSSPLREPKVPSRRRLDHPGVIELSSGAFFFWMRGYLHVAEHPYYGRTDAQGRFTLDKVPAGSHELVCWLPNWKVAKKNRDPETGLIIQLDFHAPAEQTKGVTLATGKIEETSFTWTLGDFPAMVSPDSAAR